MGIPAEIAAEQTAAAYSMTIGEKLHLKSTLHDEGYKVKTIDLTSWAGNPYFMVVVKRWMKTILLRLKSS
ncbi:hypothetical protein KIH41_07120 [Litoribacter ruber]|uniref:hypothetical protein n=1 Tax=Litoribacter ruber TaxID=702568 RepID=UPI001BDA33FA|nr:hypothetical protein [Litoribacter ruber]MBT0811049.1 hypothetical protein [Litoribacter ruber]